MLTPQIQLRWGDGYLAIDPEFPEELRKQLRYYHRSVQWDERQLRRVATGRYRDLYTVELLRDRPGLQLITLPGFAHRVREFLTKRGIPFTFIDERTPPPPANIEHACTILRPYQYECAYTALKSGGGVIACPTGWGKCLGPNDLQLHYDGTMRRAGDVRVGDVLMGDDSTPRRVLARKDGHGPMYRITPKNGVPFTVADNHTLCLVKSGNCKRDKYPDGHIVELTVAEYMKQSKTFKHRHKLYRVPVRFPRQPVPINPYFLGLWLGDGDSSAPIITTDDEEVVSFLRQYAVALGMGCSLYGYGTRTPRYALVSEPGQPNPLRQQLRNVGLCNNKHIPRQYSVNDRDTRLQLLAGLLDSDGGLNARTDYRFTSTSPALAAQVAQLARTLGFRVHEGQREVWGFGVRATAYRVGITGDTCCIPTRIARKQATRRQQKKHSLRTGFTVERIADGPYVGVQLDGNQRYLLGDCTVTHNTYIIASILKAYDPEELKLRGTPLSVVATPDKEITRKDFEDLKSILPDREVGLVMSGFRQFADDIQVITLDSMHHLNLDEVGVLVVDEVHAAASAKRTDMLIQTRRALRWGVSATPSGRFDGRDLATEGMFGPSIYTRTYGQGVEDGALVPIVVYWVQAPEPPMGIENYLKYKTRQGRYRNAVWRNEALNAEIGRMIRRVDPEKHQLLCIMQYLDQMSHLFPHCGDASYVHAETKGDKLAGGPIGPIAPKERRAIYDAMRDGEIRKILSTYVYKQGVNFPQLDIGVNAGGGGSELVAKQIPGRQSRNIDGKDVSYLIDFWKPWDWTTDKRKRRVPGPVHRDDLSRRKYYEQLGFKQMWVQSVDELPFLEPIDG
jgi:superfamily II DNA or RNA helicase